MDKETEENFKKSLRAAMTFNPSSGTISFDILMIVRAIGWEDTDENRDRMTAEVVRATTESFPETERLVETNDPQATKIAFSQAGVRATIRRRKSRWR